MLAVNFKRFYRSLFGTAIAAGLTAASFSDVIHVPADAPTIQAGIELAESGDTVLVAAGTYNEVIDFLGKTIIVESSAGAEQTIIDGTGLDTSVVTVTSGEGVGTELRGFTITGGIGTLFGTTLGGDGGDGHRAAAIPELLVQMPDGTTEVAGGAVAGGGSRFGGGVYVSGSAIVIEACIIVGNHVPSNGGSGGGGGFLVGQPQGVVFRDCVIEDNTAFLGGGGIVSTGSIQILSSTFRNNAADQGGGFNVNNNANAFVGECIFDGNIGGHLLETAVSGGGAIVLPNSTGSFFQTQFIENTSTRNGGGLSVSGLGTTVNQCVFEQNTAVRGGGIYSSGLLNVLASQFIGNEAAGDEMKVGGGGLYVDDMFSASNTTLSDSTFIGNSVSGALLDDLDGGGGGALLARTVTMTDCTFEDNTSNTYGGGVSVVLSTTAVPNISGCTFKNNNADVSGGGLSVRTTSTLYTSIHVMDCHFEGNTAHEGGGFVRSGNDGGSLVSGSTFIENSAAYNGGAMSLLIVSDTITPGRLQVVDCSFKGNSAGEGLSGGGAVSLRTIGGVARADFRSCTFEDNSGALGGGALVFATGSPTNPWPPSKFIECTFEGNTAVDGAGLNINLNGSAMVLNCTFNGNTAQSYGGAMIVMSSGFGYIAKSHFGGNQANFGGAMSLPSENDNHVRNCTFEANTALTDGGAIHGARYYTISHCLFVDNIAGQHGGAILADGFDPFGPHIYGGTFTGNVAGDEGGAIYIPWVGTAKLQGVLACDNSPDNVAGPFLDLGNNVIDGKCSGGAVIHVPQDYGTIQGAIDAADWGDEIVVAPGLYAETIDYSGKRVVVRSSDGPDVTIIDPTGGTGAGFDTGTVVTVASGEGAGTTLRGFTITGGSGPAGRGVQVTGSLLVIDDCIITGNGGGSGAGINALGAAYFAEVTVINSRISNNAGGNFGGGVRALDASVHLIGTVVEGNSATFGGGISVTGNISGLVTCSECEIRDNIATSGGGGVAISQNGQFVAADSLFCGNAPDHVGHYPGGVPWTEGDLGGNVFLDDCPAEPVLGDLNGDGVVDVSDLLILLAAWGTCPKEQPCPADVNNDGEVDVSDLLILLGNWG